MQWTTLTAVEESKQLVSTLLYLEMLRLEEKLDTLLQREQELNANGP